MEPKTNTEIFKEELQKQLDAELDNRETFPKEIREKIKETYKNLWEQKKAWLEEQKKKEGLS